MKQCKAKMRTYGAPLSKADLGQRCPDAPTDGAYCWVHAQRFKREKLPPLRPASRPSIADRWARLDALAGRVG